MLQAIPVTAAVQDNSESAFARIATFLGFEKEDNVPEDYGGSLVERVNYLEQNLNQKLDDQAVLINNIYRVSASNAYSVSQVKSTKASAVSPKQVVLHWNCTQDNNCSSSSSSSNALSNWTDIKAFNIYYGTTANASKMDYYGSIDKDDSKLFYQNYSYTVSGLTPGTTYYFWVTSVMSDDVELEDSSAVRTVVMPSLASAQASGLSLSIVDGSTLKASWSGNYGGYVKYKIYWSTSSFTATSSTTAKATVAGTTKSYNITGLTAGQTYYVAVCAVLKDGSTWVGNGGSGNYASSVTQYPFSSMSWSEIRSTLRNRKGAGFSLGSTKVIDLTSMGAGNATVTIVDVSSDGSTMICMITDYDGTIPTHCMNSTATNSGSWEQTSLRSWLNGSGYYSKLPADLQNVIVNSTVITGDYNGTVEGAENITTTDKLFLPAEKQIYGDRHRSTENEANVLTQFGYFAKKSNIKPIVGQSRWGYWCRSPYYMDQYRFTGLYTSASSSSTFAEAAQADYRSVCPCFTIK